MSDADPAVVMACVEAMVWIRHPTPLQCLLDALGGGGKPIDRQLLAIGARIAGPDLTPHVLELCNATALGAQRWRLLASLGSPQALPILIDAMRSDDPSTSLAAAAAYRRLTGQGVDSERRISVPPQDNYDPETDVEFAESGWAPDHERAAAIWHRLQATLGDKPRVAGGVPVDDDNTELDVAPSLFEWRSSRMRRAWRLS